MARCGARRRPHPISNCHSPRAEASLDSLLPEQREEAPLLVDRSGLTDIDAAIPSTPPPAARKRSTSRGTPTTKRTSRMPVTCGGGAGVGVG